MCCRGFGTPCSLKPGQFFEWGSETEPGAVVGARQAALVELVSYVQRLDLAGMVAYHVFETINQTSHEALQRICGAIREDAAESSYRLVSDDDAAVDAASAFPGPFLYAIDGYEPQLAALLDAAGNAKLARRLLSGAASAGEAGAALKALLFADVGYLPLPASIAPVSTIRAVRDADAGAGTEAGNSDAESMPWRARGRPVARSTRWPNPT